MVKQDKAAKKAASQQRRRALWGRVQQVFEAFRLQRREDRLLLPLMLGTLVGVTLVLFLVGLVFDLQWQALPVGIAFGLLGAVVVFGRRVQANVYRKADGQPGAAGWALENLRGKWRLSQAVTGNSQLDAVHRVIGRPGIVLVGEGRAHRVRSLLAQEKKRVSRLVGDTPIYEFSVGDGEDQVTLRKLQGKVMKLPRNISTSEVDSLENRLNALANRGNSMPKGPAPQGAKMRNPQRSMRRR